MSYYQILTNGKNFRIEAKSGDEWKQVAFAPDGYPAIGVHMLDHPGEGGWQQYFETEEDAEAAALKAWGMSRSRNRVFRVI